jgi:transposase
LVAGLRLRGLTAAKTFDGPINAALFEDWLETCLVPTLSPGEIVVMDNLPAHKGPRVEQLIKVAGAELRRSGWRGSGQRATHRATLFYQFHRRRKIAGTKRGQTTLPAAWRTLWAVSRS